MEDSTNTTPRLPGARAWYCESCDTEVGAMQTLEHLESPLHRLRTESQLPRGELSENWADYDTESEDEEEDREPEQRTSDVDEDDEDDEQHDELSKAMYREGEDKVSAEQEVLGEHRMLWTCDVCSTTLAVSLRDYHLLSRPHILAARRESLSEPLQSTKPGIPTTWSCSLCDVKMAVVYQATHITGKKHLRLASQQNSRPSAYSTPYAPRLSHGSIATGVPSADTLRQTFYCATCAAEFPCSTQNDHHATAATWTCTVCPCTVHTTSQSQHLHSTAHIQATHRTPQKPPRFFCTVCRLSCAHADKAMHLAGTSHRSRASNLGSGQSHVPQSSQVPQSTSTARTTPPAESQQGPVPWFCHLCGENQYSEPRIPHLTQCTATAQRRAVPANPRPAPRQPPPRAGSLYCGICNLSIMPPAMPAHLASKKHSKKAGKTPTIAAVDAVPIVAAPYTTIQGETFYCAACVRTRLAVGLADHVESKQHKRKVAAAVAAGVSLVVVPPVAEIRVSADDVSKDVSIIGDAFYCRVCVCTRKLEGMTDHVRSKKHKRNVRGR